MTDWYIPLFANSHILETVWHQIMIKVQNRIWKISHIFYEACDIHIPVTTIKM